MAESSSDPEVLFEAVARRDWTLALRAVHAGRGQDDPVSLGARNVLLDAVRAALSRGDSDLKDEDLEKLILLHRAGVLKLADSDLDRLVAVLVTRNRDRPERAVQFARYRPEVDASRGVIAQFESPGRNESADATGRLTRTDQGSRIDGRRSVFRSGQERLLYAAGIRVFSGQLLIPNAALHAAIDFASIAGLLSPSDRTLFFRVLIDLVVFDPADGFRASWFFELDSPWHDDPRAVERDRSKERMLALAGCSLTRIRTSGPTDLAGMQSLIRSAVGTA